MHSRVPADTDGRHDDARARLRPGVIRVAVVLVPVLALLAFLGVGAFKLQPRSVGSPAPSFDLERLDGTGNLRSADLRGRPYVVNFWASWCIPCREEARVLAKVVGEGRGEPAFLGVNILDGREEARGFVEEYEIRYPNLRDEGATYRGFGVTGIPETHFVDRRGQIAGRWIGAIDEKTLRQLLADLLELGPGETLRITRAGPSVGVP